MKSADSAYDLDEEGASSVQQWQNVKFQGAPPRVRSLHVGIVLQDALYIFGGYDGSNRVNDFHKFDFKRQKWSQINTTTTPSARDRHVVVSFGKSLFIFGGYDGNNRVNDFWEYNTEEN